MYIEFKKYHELILIQRDFRDSIVLKYYNRKLKSGWAEIPANYIYCANVSFVFWARN